jgi:hypothetical protein
MYTFSEHAPIVHSYVQTNFNLLNNFMLFSTDIFIKIKIQYVCQLQINTNYILLCTQFIIFSTSWIFTLPLSITKHQQYNY